MAPKKRKDPAEPPATQSPEKRVTRSATLAAMRLTRSGSKYGSIPISGSGSGSGSSPRSSPLGAEKKKAKQSKNEVEVEKKEEEEKGGASSSSKPGKTIIIERCSQCRSFSVRATKVKDDLEEKVPDITVKVNPEKPRRGCFEIREEGGETFISLLNMRRPFKPMKDLDMDKVISDIVEKIKGNDDTKIGNDDTNNGKDTANE